MSSTETTWVKCIESCRNFKVDVHSIVGVIKWIVFLTNYGTQIHRHAKCPPFAGWAGISKVKPADPPNLGSNQHLRKVCKNTWKRCHYRLNNYACWVGLKLSPAIRRFSCAGFHEKKDASAHYTREEKGCVDTFRLRERGEYVRPPSVALPPHQRPASELITLACLDSFSVFAKH